MSRKRSTKFVQLAEARVTRALRHKACGNLSNRSNYVYTDEDAKIIAALKKAVDETKSRFEARVTQKQRLSNCEFLRRQRGPAAAESQQRI